MDNNTFIIIAMFTFILGTIMMLKPTPQQRKQNQFRSKAIGNGIQIGYIKAKQVNKYNPNNLISYSKRLSDMDNIDDNIEAIYQRSLSTKQFDTDNAEVQQQLDKLPLSVGKVSYREQQWSILWNESGTIAELDTIIDILDWLSSNNIKP